MPNCAVVDASNRRTDVTDSPHEQSSGDIFADIGFQPADAAELTVKSRLIMALGDIIKKRELTQHDAAQLCGTDQPTLSKVLRGWMETVTIDKLAAWLKALGLHDRVAKVVMAP